MSIRSFQCPNIISWFLLVVRHYVKKVDRRRRFCDRGSPAYTFEILAVVVAIVLVGPGSGPCNATSDPVEIHVGSELDFPPYAFTDDKGQPVGFSVDLIKAVADSMNLPINISTGTWDNLWNALVAGRLDILPIVAKLPDRLPLVDFSLPHTETYEAFFVRPGNPPLKNIEAAKGKDIVVMRSDAAHHALLKHNFQGNLVLVDTISEGLSLIAAGKRDAFLCSKLIGTMVINKLGLKDIVVGPIIPDYKRVFSFAVKKGDTELIEKLNQGLLIIKTSGEYDRIYEKWLAIDDPWRKAQKYFIPAIVIVGTIALIFILWLLSLHRLVKKRTRELSEKNEMLLLAQDGLETRVAQRTSELEHVNLELQTEIAERKLADEALRKSEEWHRTILQTAMEGVCLVNLQGRFLEVNDAYCRMVGYSEQELLAMNISDIEANEMPAEIAVHMQKIITRSDDCFETRHRCKDGRILEVEISSQYKPTEGGLIVSFIRDITDRKQAAEALRRERNQAQMYLDVAGVMLCILDAEGRITLMNAKGLEILGYTAEEIVGCNWFDICLPRRLKTEIWGVFIQLMADDIEPVEYYENPIVNRSGEELIIAFHNTILRDKANKIVGILFSGEDITKRKRAEEEQQRLQEQLIQAQKMEAIGTLAGGIAHDFNNILWAIMGFTELTLNSIPEGSREYHNLQQVLKASERAKYLVNQILAFSRKTSQERKPLQISLIVKEAIKLLRATIPTTIEIKQDIASPEAMVSADPTQMHQVIMNLCTNSAHAMREKGDILEVGLEEKYLDQDSLLGYHDLTPGPYVILTVNDNGPGIAPEIIDRIFDPFFTTKEVGEGTGMGLAAVYGIVKSHGGWITVSSQPGAGTTVTILLPKIVSGDAGVKEVLAPIPKGTGRILVIDDEKVLIDLHKEMLESLGYDTVPINSSLEALKIFQAQPDKFDLVITDQTMPHMTGIQLSHELRRIRHDISIILCTGYSETVSEEKVKAVGINALLMKPINLRNLAETVLKVLDKENQ
jgi:PAS domain S-box-containing protein